VPWRGWLALAAASALLAGCMSGPPPRIETRTLNGFRILEPAGLPELVEGKVDALIDRSPRHHPSYRCERLENDSGGRDYLICPEGTAHCPEIERLRAWLKGVASVGWAKRAQRSGARVPTNGGHGRFARASRP